MPNPYKKGDSVIFFNDEQITAGIPLLATYSGSVQMTDAEYADYQKTVAAAQSSISEAAAVAAQKSQAIADLLASDKTVLRCIEAGITPIPATWVTYRAALRPFADGTAPAGSTYPTRPDYPQGT